MEFPFLRGAEVIVERLEIRTGINHATIEPQAIKVIRNIVMKPYDVLVLRE